MRQGSNLALSVCSLRLHPPLPRGEALAKRGSLRGLPKALPVRKDFPRPGENVVQRQKGEAGERSEPERVGSLPEGAGWALTEEVPLYVIGIKPSRKGHTTSAAGARRSFPPAKSLGIVHLAQKKRNSTKQRK